MKDAKFCNDYGDNPLCQKVPDERFTMRFDDIGEEPILWCNHCGRLAKAMGDALNKAFKERGSEFVDEFKSAVDKAESERITS